MPYRDGGDDARRVHLRMLERITVTTPCTEKWPKMAGDERVRHCARCEKDVYNLSAMSLDEIATLVHELEGNLCARFYRRPDGSIVTGDCTTSNRARRVARRAGAAVVAAGIAGAAAILAAPHEPFAPPAVVRLDGSDLGDGDDGDDGDEYALPEGIESGGAIGIAMGDVAWRSIPPVASTDD